MIETVNSALEREEIEYKRDFSVRDLSTFKIGGVCDLVIFPKSEDELVSALKIIDSCNLKCRVIGKGSNLIFADGRLDTVLIFTQGVNGVSFDGTRVSASCGASLTALSHACAERGLSGLEFACGIPGSIGGSMFMNAGAYGGCMADVTVSSRAYDRETGEVTELFEHGFSYRDSIYMRSSNLVCLGAEFELKRGDSEEIKVRNSSLLAERRAKQPLSYPSAGSYFKRPAGHFAGKLIEDCGLKGFRIGDAAVSEKHAGFIINLGGATFDDVMRLEAEVRRVVLDKFGVELCREVEVVK